MNRTTLKEKLETNSIPIPPSSCLIWIGTCCYGGYGRIGHNYNTFMAHRASYQEFVGPIPKNKFVLHKCDQPACINPEHLYVGTAMDNSRDISRRKRGHNAKKTHCKYGHPFSGSNLYETKYQRRCMTCHYVRAAQYRMRKKQKSES